MLPALFTMLAACVRPDVSPPLGPGISRALADYRSARITNVRYTLTLDVTRHDTATGHVEIAFDRRDDGDVVLDFRGLHVANGVVNGKRLATIDHDGAHIRIPERNIRDGANTVAFDFAARIAPAGASIIRFHDAVEHADYLYTLLVPADANQLFPCFDQPDLKAQVTLRLTVPRGWSAVANGPLAATDTAKTGITTFRFTPTPPISTYLIAFATGPWTRVTRMVAGRPMTMYVRASRAKEAEADTLIAANARAMAWLTTYFGIPYPFPKLDFVLAPAFPFGGMEHPGAIFYNEDAFIFREPPTVPQLLGREETIYHEVAHQWFGDFVTMRWFDDLWLKEGFATYTAAMMQAGLDTSSGAAAGTWKRFFLRHKPEAYAVDGSQGTAAIWQPLDNLDQAKSNYGPIVYDKAPGILKQLHFLVGDSAFRHGVHRFLEQHAYATATWHDLLDAIGAAAGRPLDDWGQQYVRRPGLPVLEQRVTVRNGKIVGVALHQRPARELSGPGAWPLRIELFVGGLTGPSVQQPVEMKGADTSIALPATGPAAVSAPALVFANTGDQGYVELALDSASVSWLLAHVGGIRDPLQRAMGWASLWDQVRDAELAPARYLAAVVRELPAERDEQIVAAILGPAVRTVTAYLPCGESDTLVSPFAAVLRRIVIDPSRPYGIRKASLNALVATLSPNDLASIQRIDTLLDRPLPGLPLGAPGRWAIVTKLLEIDAPKADERLAEEIRRDSTSDGQRRAFVARAARPTARAKQAFFERYLRDSTLNEDWAASSLRAFNSPNARALTLPYLPLALDTLPWLQRNRRIFFIGEWLGAFLDGQVSDSARRIVDAVLRRTPGPPPDLRRKIQQAADELERTVAIRRRFGGGGMATRCRGHVAGPRH